MSEVKWTPEQQAQYEKMRAEWQADAEQLRADPMKDSESTVIPLKPSMGGAERLKAARAKAEEDMKNWPTEAPKAASSQAFDSDEDGVNAGRQRSLLTKLNKKHAVLNNVGGKCLVAEWVPNPIDKSRKILSLQSFDCVEKRYSNQFVSDGSSRTKPPLGKWWLAHKERRTYEGLVLVADGPEVINGFLNL